MCREHDISTVTLRALGLGAIGLAALLVAACSESDTGVTAHTDGDRDASVGGVSRGPAATSDAAGLDAAGGRAFARPDGPPPRRWVEVRLPPVIEFTQTDAGFGDSLPSIEGARVCLNRWRPKGDGPDGSPHSWTLVQDDERWCTDSVVDRDTVLREVPEESEVVITAHLDGYVPAAYPLIVATGPQDLGDIPAGWLISTLPMFRADVPASSIPETRNLVDGDHGALSVIAGVPRDGERTINGFYRYAGLGDARLSLRERTGGADGPFYAPSGLYDPSLDRTVGQALSDPSTFVEATRLAGVYSGLGDAVSMIGRLNTTVTFLGLAEGEYHVEIRHDRATCDLTGYQINQSLWGFFEGKDVIRAPVIAGHYTAFVGFFCTCDASDVWVTPEYADPLTCTLAPSDAGAD